MKNNQKMIKKEFFIPKYKRKKKILKQCIFPGCKNTFVGYPHARFCNFHKNPATRISSKKKEKEEETMVVLKHNYKSKTTIVRQCDCCDSFYKIELFPDCEIYPRFCENHRSKFRREYWRKIHGKN